MKYICFSLFIFLVYHNGEAQKKQKEFGFHLAPCINARYITSSYKDSLNRMDKPRLGLGFGFDYIIKIDNFKKIQTGLYYREYGFTRVKSDLKFLDTIHPQIGVIFDISQSVSKDVYFNYKYQYLEIPLIYNFSPVKNTKSDIMALKMSAGISTSILLKHNFIALLKGYTYEQKNKFNITNTGFNPNPINVNFILGTRFEYKIFNNVYINTQPLFVLPILNANKDVSEKHHLFNFTTIFSLTKILD